MLALALLLAILPDSIAADSLAPRPAVLSAAASADWAETSLSVRLPAAFGELPEALPTAPDRGVSAGASAAAGGSAALLGSLVGGLGGGLVYGLVNASGNRAGENTSPLAYGFVAVGSVVGAAAGVAYFGEPLPPFFAGIPTGEPLLRPTDWQVALPGILVATPVGLALGYVAGRTVGRDAPLLGPVVALPIAQGIGAGLAVLRSRRAERR